MASIKRSAVVASTLMLIAMIASACNQPYSQQPSITATPINPTSLFATPIGQTPSMGDVELFGTGTALALSGTPAGIATQTQEPALISPQDLTATVTPTPLVSVNSTSTLAISAATSGPLATSLPVGVRPTEYLLRPGEFPYCIARRFDVNPDELLRVNGLSSGEIFYANRTLKIPQSGTFPGTRALQPHPTTYTVKAGETLYTIACKYGDLDPAAIVKANNLSSEVLTAGQVLNFPP